MGDTEKILKAVKCLNDVQVESTKQITKRLDVVDERQVEQGKAITEQGKDISAVRESQTGHLAWHNGAKEAKKEFRAQGAETTAKSKAIGTWVKVGLTVLGMLVTSLLFVLGIGATSDEGPDETKQLQASIDKLTQVVDKMADKAP